MARNESFAVTIPSHLQPKFSKIVESLGLSRQEAVLYLVSEGVVPTVVEDKGPANASTVPESTDWNATEPYFFGPSNFGFYCVYHKTRHESGTDMVYAGPEPAAGNRKRICGEAANELQLNFS